MIDRTFLKYLMIATFVGFYILMPILLLFAVATAQPNNIASLLIVGMIVGLMMQTTAILILVRILKEDKNENNRN